MPLLAAGQRLGGYEIIAFHAKGGMGEIYRATQLSIGRGVALKIMHPELVAKDPAFVRRFREEAQAAGRLNHPAIIAVHDVGSDVHDERELAWFSMEFVEGENFRVILEREGALPIERVAKVMAPLADALAYAHRMGMVHRDIKPENIMQTPDGRIKLADFGLAMQIEGEVDGPRDANGRPKAMGTPRYMSPEQARGKPLDGRSDQYSLGATLFHLLTGRPPFEKPTPRELMRAHVSDPVPDPGELAPVPQAWRNLCLRLLAKTPEERYADPADLVKAIEAAIEMPNGPRRRLGPTQGNLRGPQTDAPSRADLRRLLPLAVVGVLALVAILVFSQSGGDDDGGGKVTTTENSAAATTAQAHPSGPPSPGNSAAEEQRARNFLNQLPRDAALALAELEGPNGLANPYFAAEGPARALLQERLTQLRDDATRLAAAAAAARREAAEAVTQAAAAGHLDQAREGLRSLRQRFPGSAEVAAAATAVDEAVRRHGDEMLAAVGGAADDAAIAAVLARPLFAQLDAATQLRLREAGEARRAALAAAAAAKGPDPAIRLRQQEAWRGLATALDGYRRGKDQPQPDPESFAGRIRRAQAQLGEPEAAFATELLETARRYAEAEQALSAWVARHPSYEVTLGGQTVPVTITERSGLRISFRMANGLGSAINLEQDPTVANRILEAAIGRKTPERLRIQAWTWFQRLPAVRESQERDRRVAETSQTAALAALEGRQTTTTGETPTAEPTPEGPFQASLDFSQPESSWRKYFQLPAGAGQADGMLLWRSRGSVDDLTAEKSLPTLALSQPLKPPFRAQAELKITARQTAVVMVGVRQGGRAWRLAAYQVIGANGSGPTRRAGAITSARVAGTLTWDPVMTDTNDDLQAWRVSLGIGKDGSINLASNDGVLGTRGNDWRLDPAQTAELIIQCANVSGNGGTEVGLRRLTVREE